MSIPMTFTGAATAEATNRMRELFPQVFGETINDGRVIVDLAKRMEKWGMEGKFQMLKNLSKDGTIGGILGALNTQNNIYKNQMEPHIRTMAETVNVLNVLKINPQVIDGLIKSGVITPIQGNILAQAGVSLKAVLNHQLNMSQVGMLAEPVVREIIDTVVEVDNRLTAIARANAMVGAVPIKELQALGLVDNVAAGIRLPDGTVLPGGAPTAGAPGYPPANPYGTPAPAPTYAPPGYPAPANPYAQPAPTYAPPGYPAPANPYTTPAPTYTAPGVVPPGGAPYPATPIVPGTAQAYDPYSNVTAGATVGSAGAPPTVGGFDPRTIIGGYGTPAPTYTAPGYPPANPYGTPAPAPTYTTPGYGAYGAPPVQYDAYGTTPVDAISLGLM